MESINCDGEKVLRTFVERTRELTECTLCVDVFRDPVEVECGHSFCRHCIAHVASNESILRCPQCQTQVSKHNLKELSARRNRLTTSVSKFLQDFCNEGDWKLDSFLGVDGAKSNQRSSRTLPLDPLKEKELIVIKNKEEAVSLSICSSISKVASTLEPQTKVQQWLMTNPGLSAGNGHDHRENASTVRGSESSPKQMTASESSSKQIAVSISNSSTGKEPSYDIVNAPSPPPHREEFRQQNKRGRGGKRGRTRTKNALPIISSGETIARKRGRSIENTPDNKQLTSTTQTGQTISPASMLEMNKSKSLSTMASTPKFSMSDTLSGKKDSIVPPQDSFLETPAMEAEEEEVTFTNNNSHSTTKESLERSLDSLVTPKFVEPSLNGFSPAAQTIPIIETKPTGSIQEKSPNLFSSVSTLNLQVENLTETSTSTSHHLTPVSRPSKIRNSFGTFGKNLQSLAPDVRRHSSAEGLLPEPGKRLVNFFHIGRIVPKKSISPIMKHPIVFTCLGKLGPKLEGTSSRIPANSNESTTCKMNSSMTVQETPSTTPLVFVSVGTQTDEVAKAIDTCVKETQTSSVGFVDDNNVMELHNKQIEKEEERERIVTMNESEKCNEEASMFTEPLKRARVLSSSEEDNEKMDTKRRKNSDSIDLLDFDPPMLPSTAELNSRMPDGSQEKQLQLESDSDMVWKTVIMESDPESDGGDILPATPPPPPVAKIIPQRKVFTCSGLPRPQVRVVEDWAKRIGVEVSSTYTPAVTHIIVQRDEENCAQRTLKFLFGVATGKWIVGVDWVHQCIRDKRLIEEEPFEALDMDGECGPRRSRQISRENKLFEAFEFCCQEPFTDVTVDQLRELLELCGAVTTPSPAELSKCRRHTMIIVQTDDDIGLEVQRKAISWFERLQVLSVSREWVLDCLAAYQLLPIRSQLIGKHSESLLRMMGFDSKLID